MKTKLIAALGCVVLGACGGGGGGGGGGIPPAALVPTTTTPVTDTNVQPVSEPPVTQDQPANGAGNGSGGASGGGSVTTPGTVTTFSYVTGNVGSALGVFDPTMRDKVYALLNTSALASYRYTGQYYPATGDGIYEKAVGYGPYDWSTSVALTGGFPASDWLTVNNFFVPAAPMQYIYGRPLSSAARYSYSPATDPADSAATLTTKLNQIGPNGFCKAALGSAGVSLISEDNSGLQCSFKVGAKSSFNNIEDYIAELNTQGALGYKVLFKQNGEYIYVKFGSMNLSYQYYSLDNVSTDQVAFLAQLNAEGAKGGRLYEQVGGTTKSIYRIDTNCNRWWLCILP